MILKITIKTLLLFILFHSVSSWAADCVNLKQGIVNFDLGDVDVPVNPAVGTVLKSYELTESDGGGADHCQGYAYAIYLKGAPTGLKYNGTPTDIYSTNIQGVGYAICFISCSPATNVYWFPFMTNYSAATNQSRSFYSFNGAWQLYLIATSTTLSSGEIEPGTYAQTGIAPSYLFESVNVSGGKIKGASCVLDNETIQVPFGDLAVSQFGEVGSTTESKTFDIGLTCDRNANVSMNLSGVKNADINDPTILALTNAGSANVAKGVGVQILYNSEPIEIGKVMDLNMASGNVKEIYSFAVRYYKTLNVITAGDANTTATLNITYQ